MKNGQKLPDVLTLPEAAKFLRLTPEKVEQLAVSAQLPGRQVDQEWRFLRSALEGWLRGEETNNLMELAGKYQGDEALLEICRDAYKKRRRSARKHKAPA